MVVQVVILYFTLRKYFTGAWKTIPLVKLISQDGTLAFSVLASMIVSSPLPTHAERNAVLSLFVAIYAAKGIPFGVSSYA